MYLEIRNDLWSSCAQEIREAEVTRRFVTRRLTAPRESRGLIHPPEDLKDLQCISVSLNNFLSPSRDNTEYNSQITWTKARSGSCILCSASVSSGPKVPLRRCTSVVHNFVSIFCSLLALIERPIFRFNGRAGSSPSPPPPGIAGLK